MNELIISVFLYYNSSDTTAILSSVYVYAPHRKCNPTAQYSSTYLQFVILFSIIYLTTYLISIEYAYF